MKTSTVSSNGRDVQDDIEKKLSDLYPNFGIDLNIIENSDENGMKFAFNIRKVSYLLFYPNFYKSKYALYT